jgi:hypothetical protein
MITTNKPLNISSQQLELAYKWLCQQRQHHPANADIWDFRFNWVKTKTDLLRSVTLGHYRFSPIKRLCNKSGQILHLWSAADSLVMKLLAEVIAPKLNLSSNCTHIKGHGGLKQSVKNIAKNTRDYQFVCKTDVKSFYESIDQTILYEQLCGCISNKHIRRYLWQVIRRTVECGGNYWELEQGISRGCPLSPLFGGLYLKAMDEHFSQQPNHYYIRYMDDILILSKTRWHNRQVVKALNHWFNRLKVWQHPDKTFIGKIERGFDFLGYHFSRKPLCLASITLQKHVGRYNQLYEQQKTKKASSLELAFILGQYRKRWQCWCSAGLDNITIELCDVLYRTTRIDLGP